MAVRMDKPWRPLDAATVAGLPGQLGVYQIGDASGEVRYIGYAGGRSLFGLRGELQAQLEARDPEGKGGLGFRVEVTTAYLTRHRELLMVHRADHGELPPDNRDHPPPGLGRLSPA
jgi:hypothetical protein